MESTQFSPTTSQTRTDFLGIEPDVHDIGLTLFRSPKYRPAVFDEIYSDCQHVIDNVARTYTDVTCPELQFEELQAEGRKRLAILIDKGYLERTKNRHDFFRCFATVLKRAVCSLVQRHRFTEKRTGVKPPPRGQRFDSENRLKTVEVHVDDPDCNIQVADTHEQVDSPSEFAELLEEFSQPLSALEKLVLNQLVHPNELAWAHCFVESRRGRHANAAIKLKLKHADYAYGLGIQEQLFSDCVLSIQKKITQLRRMSTEQQQARVRYHAALTQLAKVFNLQIPPVDDIVIRRMLTLAARDQIEKVSDDVKALLQEVGAVVPVKMGKDRILSCFGVLFSRVSPRCASCGIKKPCEVKARSVGLTEITPSPELIGYRNIRIPVVSSDEPPEDTPREMEIMAYLDENFERGTPRGHLSFRHRDTLRWIVQVDRGLKNQFLVKFIAPSEGLGQKLVNYGKAQVADLDASAADVIALIDQHAKETLNG